MNSKSVRYAFWSQLSLYGFLAVCTALMPQFLFSRNEGGVSNYGIYARTIIPYSLAFGLCGIFLLSAARNLPRKTKLYRSVRNILWLVAGLSFFAVLTTYTYKLTPFLKHIHEVSAISLFFAEFFIGLWFALKLYRDRLNLLLLALEAVFIALGALTFFGFLHVLFIAEVGTGIAFGALMVRTISRLN
jgi:hypothetical protein